MIENQNRAVRKDVARNRQRLLDAGKEVFAARGLDATLDDIARHAGVGAGTAYRHFASRQEIINAIFADAAQTFILDAEHAQTLADPWAGFVDLVEAFTYRLAKDRGLHQVFTGDHSSGLQADDWNGLITAVTEIVERAKRAGHLREDIEPSDVFTLFMMLGPAYDLSTATSTGIWRRHVDLFLRAVQTDAPTAVIDAPRALTTQAISQLISPT
jgi:AcrR family transcriptional regulator